MLASTRCGSLRCRGGSAERRRAGMNGVRPIGCHLIPCESIFSDTGNPRRSALVGLVHKIVSQGHPPYPYRHRELLVFVGLLGCQGPARVGLRITQTDTGQVIYSRVWSIALGNNPDEVV